MSPDPSLDLSGVVGWLTSLIPVVVEVGAESSTAATLRSAREALRTVARRGQDYGIVRYHHPDPDVRNSLRVEPSSTVLFNYLGKLDGPAGHRSRFSVKGPLELSTPQDAPPNYGLEVNAWISEGSLTMVWTHPEDAMARAEIESLAGRSLEHLKAIMEEPTDAHEVRSAAEFPNANLDDEGLSKLAALLSDKGTN